MKCAWGKTADHNHDLKPHTDVLEQFVDYRAPIPRAISLGGVRNAPFQDRGHSEYRYRMTVLRRLCAITLQCSLLAMTVAGSGNPCGARDDHASHMSMSGMEMPDMQTDTDGAPAESHSGCPLPVSVAGCHAMASCAPSAVVVDSEAPVVMASRTHSELAARAEQLRSVTRAPELPPPRA